MPSKRRHGNWRLVGVASALSPIVAGAFAIWLQLPASVAALPVSTVGLAPAGKSPADIEKQAAPSTQPVQRGVARRNTDDSAIRKVKHAVLPKTFGYRWRAGDQHSYEFCLRAELDGDVHEATGTCDYKVGVPKALTAEEKPQGSGTGFVVGAEGYIVTCAHVVRDAATIEAVIDGQRHIAQVIASNVDSDLALLKINKGGLPTVPLGKAEDILLGEMVFVIGYPLSPMLGSSVKMSTGSVTGAVDTLPGESRRFQVDATLNPGNSGGPVVNERGEVLGVASELLAHARLADVGFAVPIDSVRSLVESAEVEIATEASSDILRASELAKRVAPAVVLIEVTADPADEQTYPIAFSAKMKIPPLPANFRNWTKGNIFRAEAYRVEPGEYQLQGSFSVGKFGSVTDYRGNLHLPGLLDQIGTLIIESLDEDGDKEWESTNLTSLNIEHHSPFPIPRIFQRPGHHNPFPQLEPQTKSYSAIEKATYRLIAHTDRDLKLEKNYKFQTLESNVEAEPLVQQGKGTVVFSKILGVPESLAFEGTIGSEEGSRIKPVKVHLSYNRLSTAEIAAKRGADFAKKVAHAIGAGMAQESQKRASRWKTTPRSSNRDRKQHSVTGLRRETNEREIDAMLGRLQEAHRRGNSGNFSRADALHALTELASRRVLPSRHDAVADMVLKFAVHGNRIEKTVAVQALAVWSTKDSVPTMLQMLESNDRDFDFIIKGDLIKILASYPSAKVQEALIALLDDFGVDDQASSALISMGPPAQQAVCKALSNISIEVRNYAAEILAEIGTSKSLPALKRALHQERDRWVRRKIERAIQAISSR